MLEKITDAHSKPIWVNRDKIIMVGPSSEHRGQYTISLVEGFEVTITKDEYVRLWGRLDTK